MGFPTGDVHNHGWQLYITSLVMIITAGIFVVARFITRCWYHKFGWDDAAILLSLICSLLVSICMQLAIENGYGMHKVDLSKTELRTALRFFFIAQTPYKVAVCANKLSVCLLYLRIFVTNSFRVACYIVIAIIVAWSIGGVGATIWQCVPIAGSWDKTIDAVCIDKSKFWVAYAVMNILTDVLVLALPIPPVLALKLNRRDKVLICGTFMLGGFVTVTSILRTTSVSDSVKNQSDITFNFIERGMWTLIETNLGIITACLPVLKEPLIRTFPRAFGGSRTASRHTASRDNYARAYSMPRLSSRGKFSGNDRDTESKKGRTVVNDASYLEETRWSDEQHIISSSAEGSAADLGSAKEEHHGRTTGS